MDKLLQIISKLRNAIVPENPLSKMSKEDILAFIEESNLLERMRTFHQRAEKGIRSAITDDEEEDPKRRGFEKNAHRKTSEDGPSIPQSHTDPAEVRKVFCFSTAFTRQTPQVRGDAVRRGYA